MQSVMERLVLYVNNNHVLDTNYRIAVYTLQHINAVVDMNIVEMAKACYVSQSSISRFCVAIGYTSYPHFKEECIKHFQMIERTPLFNVSEMNNKVDLISQQLNRISKEVDNREIMNLINDIKKANIIYIFAFGSTSFILQHLQLILIKLGKMTYLVNDIKEMEKKKSLEEKALLLIFSMKGRLLDSFETLPLVFKDKKYKSYLITQCNESKKEEWFDEVIHLPAQEDFIVSQFGLYFFIYYLLNLYEKNEFVD